MADLTSEPPASASSGAFSPLSRQQYSAIIWLQSRIFINSFRTLRGSYELGAQIFTGFLFLIIAVSPAVGMGFGAYFALSADRPLGVAVLLWILCIVWQGFSVLAPALAGQNPDLSHLLRFPVSFGSWILLFLVYGVIAPSTLIGILWITGLGIGVFVARPDLLVHALLTLALFAIFNILLSRTLLAWLERWMAQRKTREILIGIFLFFVLGLQLLNPALHNYGHHPRQRVHAHQALHLDHRLWIAQAFFPPGAASQALIEPMQHDGSGALPLSGLLLYTAAVIGLLCLRLRAESRGENFSEAPRRTPALRQPQRRLILDFSGPIAAVFEKDLRSILRSGPMLYALAAPLVMAIAFGGVFRSSTGASFRGSYALPLGFVWAFLCLARIVGNNLGTEGEGLSLFFLSPTPLRTVVLAKNALHLALFAVEAVLITAFVVIRTGLPPLSLVAATAAWLLFALPAYFAAGNLLSILMPFRLSMVRMRREPGAIGNSLASALVLAGIVGVGAAVLVPCAALGHPWLAPPLLLIVAAAGCVFYLRVLSIIDRMMLSRRETLLFEIAKTA